MTKADFSPAIVNIEIVRGDSLDVTVPLVTETGEDVDLSDYTPSATLIGDKTAVTKAFTATKVASAIRLQMMASDIEGLDNMNSYDLQLINGGATVVRTITRGKVRVLPQITT